MPPRGYGLGDLITSRAELGAYLKMRPNAAMAWALEHGLIGSLRERPMIPVWAIIQALSKSPLDRSANNDGGLVDIPA